MEGFRLELTKRLTEAGRAARPPRPETSTNAFESKEIIMNTKSLIAAAALALVGSAAFAQTNYTEDAMFRANPASTLTRAEVRAEFLRARAADELPVSSDVAPVVVAKAPQKGGLTREQVIAQLKKARADGTDVQPLDFTLAIKGDAATGRSRADVHAEAVAFTQSGRAARVQAGY
jgi:hypothetical protein